MGNKAQSALLSWGGGFVTAATFGAVGPHTAPQIEAPRSNPIRGGGMVPTIAAMGANVRRAMRTPAGKTVVAIGGNIAPCAMAVANRMNELQRRMNRKIGNAQGDSNI